MSTLKIMITPVSEARVQSNEAVKELGEARKMMQLVNKVS